MTYLRMVRLLAVGFGMVATIITTCWGLLLAVWPAVPNRPLHAGVGIVSFLVLAWCVKRFCKDLFGEVSG